MAIEITIKKRKVCFWRALRAQGKKFDWLAKIGWRLAPDFGVNVSWQSVYEKIRTEFKENF